MVSFAYTMCCVSWRLFVPIALLLLQSFRIILCDKLNPVEIKNVRASPCDDAPKKCTLWRLLSFPPGGCFLGIQYVGLILNVHESACSVRVISFRRCSGPKLPTIESGFMVQESCQNSENRSRFIRRAGCPSWEILKHITFKKSVMDAFSVFGCRYERTFVFCLRASAPYAGLHTHVTLLRRILPVQRSIGLVLS